jgi:predicted acyltransferase (DUF342 family)
MRQFLVFIVCLVSASVTPAIQIIATESFTVNSDETITNECWVAAKAVEVSGTVQDDFLAICPGGPALFGNARLRGAFQNDVWALGNSVELTGTTEEHARLFATSEIILGGQVGISAVAVGKTVTLTTNFVTHGDALLVGQSVVVAGDIRGNLKVLADAVTLHGHVNGNVRIVANDIVVMPGTKIGGDLVYTAPKDLFLDPGQMELDGRLVRKEFDAIQVKTTPPTLYDIIVTQAVFYLGALAAGIPFVAIFPRFTGQAVRWIRQSAWKCTLVGFVSFCLIPMTSLFVFFTIIGIPLSLLLLLIYMIMIYLSKIVVALGIGGIALRRHGPQPFRHVFSALSLGLIAIYVVTALPFLGLATAIVVLLTGLGGMVLAIFSSQLAANQPLPPPIPQTDGSFDSQSDVSWKEPTKKE